MMTPVMLSPRDVAKVLGISYEAALSFIKHSGLDYVKLGRSYRVAEDKLTSFLLKKGQQHIDLTP